MQSEKSAGQNDDTPLPRRQSHEGPKSSGCQQIENQGGHSDSQRRNLGSQLLQLRVVGMRLAILTLLLVDPVQCQDA